MGKLVLAQVVPVPVEVTAATAVCIICSKVAKAPAPGVPDTYERPYQMVPAHMQLPFSSAQWYTWFPALVYGPVSVSPVAWQ